MEIELAKYIGDSLLGSTDVTAIIGDRFSPLYADEEVNPPFVTYVINEIEPASKDGSEAYEIFLALVAPAKGYTLCMQLKKKVKDALQGGELMYRGSDVSIDEQTWNIVCVLRYEAVVKAE